jgi:hypothetical protein
MKISIPIYIALLCLCSLTLSAQQRDKDQVSDYIIFEIVDNDPFEILTDSVLIIDFGQGTHKYSDENNQFSIERSDNILLLYGEKYVPKLIQIQNTDRNPIRIVKLKRNTQFFDEIQQPKSIRAAFNSSQVKFCLTLKDKRANLKDKRANEINPFAKDNFESIKIFPIDTHLIYSINQENLCFNIKLSNNILANFSTKRGEIDNMMEFVAWQPDTFLKRFCLSERNVIHGVDTIIQIDPEQDFIGKLKNKYFERNKHKNEILRYSYSNC